MIFSQVVGYITQDAVNKVTPSTKKEYAFFIVVSKDDKNKDTFVRCYLYGCSDKRLKTLTVGTKVIIYGEQNVSLFQKDNGESDINININVDKLLFI